jgi:hypothetical protein
MQMSANVSTLRLSVDCSLVEPDAPNFRPPSWPLPPGFPIVVDKDGHVVSRYRDPIWDLTPWNNGITLRLHFRSSGKSKKIYDISVKNSNLLKKITAWILYFDRTRRKVTSIFSIIRTLKPIFTLCTENNILASDLHKYPDIVDQAINLIKKQIGHSELTTLHLMLTFREQFGFFIFDQEGLRRLSAFVSKDCLSQTAYIPPRIWVYQLNCLRACIDDFNAHVGKVVDCYRFCLEAYASSFGTLEKALKREDDSHHKKPFVNIIHNKSSAYGSFFEVAKQFEIAELLKRWVGPESVSIENIDVSYLSRYLNTVSTACLAYIINFSLMRISEGLSLRVNCLKIENDALLGQIYFVCGPTTKSYEDNDAKWIVSPSTQVAIKAATVIANLRAKILTICSKNGTPVNESDNPELFISQCEPWVKRTVAKYRRKSAPKSYHTLFATRLSQVFDLKELTITKEDLDIALLVTPSLDINEYQVGKIWPLGWHELRRTGMVNMQASGIVSDASMQFQAKHARRAMSIYYGQGYSGVALNNRTRNEYICTMYEMMGKEIDRLFGDRFVSPYGENRKEEILRYVNHRDAKKVLSAAKQGLVTCRETLLGICTKRGPCKFGGIENITRCGGGDERSPCSDALFDREKDEAIAELIGTIDEQLLKSTVGSALHDSLLAQKRAAENARGYFKK